MPQLEPYTLALQWGSAWTLIAVSTVGLACYVLPQLSKLYTSRTQVTIK